MREMNTNRLILFVQFRGRTWRLRNELSFTVPTHCFKFASPRIMSGVISDWSSAKSNPKFSFTKVFEGRKAADLLLVKEDAGA